MDEGVAVDFRGRGEQESRLLGQRQAQHMVGADRPHLDDLDGVGGEVDRRGWRGEVEHVGHLAFDGDFVADVVLDELEAAIASELVQVLRTGGDQIVEDHYAGAAID